MKPQLLRLSTEPSESFAIRKDLSPDVNNKWHYHTEIELIHFNKGKGAQFVGDSIQRFQPGDILLLGSELPHWLRFDEPFFEKDTNLNVDVRVSHFSPSFLGEAFFNIPESKMIKDLLETSKRGIKVGGSAKKVVGELMERMLNSQGIERILILLQALQEIANCPGNSILSSVGFKHDYNESERLNDLYSFVLKHFKRKISLEEIATVANVSPHSFCRFFKTKSGKTFSQFVLELKVGHACKLLIEGNLNVKQVCFESGFNNFGCFHKYFKKITGKSPAMYQKEFLNRNKVISLFSKEAPVYKEAN